MIPLDNTALQRATSGVPEWLAARRTAGYDHFDKLAMPTSQEEVWKYVDLDFDLADFAMADVSGRPRQKATTKEKARRRKPERRNVKAKTPQATAATHST